MLQILIQRIKQIFKKKKPDYQYLEDTKSEYGYDDEFIEYEERECK